MELFDQPPFEPIRRSRKGFFRRMVFVAIGLFALWGSCHIWANSPFAPWAGVLSNGCFPWDPQKTEALGGYKFPPSMSNLETYCQGVQGYISTAKFEMAPGDVNGLIATTMIKLPLSLSTAPPDFTSFLQRLVGERNPGVYLYGKAENGDFIQEILIDTSDPAKYVVYVVILAG